SESGQRERVVELQTKFLALKDGTQALETQAKAVRFEQTELGELLHQIELDRVQAQAELERTFERLRVEYDLTADAWQPPVAPEGWDPDAARTQLEEARGRYRALGAVNLLAIEEYEKKKERFTFLTQQREDLISARAQLLEAIEKINVT